MSIYWKVWLSIIAAAMIGTGFAADAQTGRQCSTYCNPEKSQPCGSGCISKFKRCRTSWTTACSGIREQEESKHYSNPEHVNQPPGWSKEKQAN